MFEKHLNEMCYKDIKNLIDNINIFDLEQKEFNMLTEELIKDPRKNVQGLGNRLIKSMKSRKNEILRVKGLYDFDRSFDGCKFIAGVDEVGRGPLAGPIVSAAVILDLDCALDDMILEINDSKALSEKKREELCEIIKNRAICYSIACCSNEEIDSKGITFCNNEIFKKACYSLKQKPDLVLSDGYPIKNFNISNKFVIKGDTKSASIACASIVAKVYRDNLMKEYDKLYPYYDFSSNVGYGTKKHIEAIKEYGICKIHRKSFLNSIIHL